MSSKTIPIAEESQASSPMRLPVPISGRIRIENGQLIDERGRPLRDLRISLTDHCNFRCRYCMPKEKFDTKHQLMMPLKQNHGKKKNQTTKPGAYGVAFV